MIIVIGLFLIGIILFIGGAYIMISCGNNFIVSFLCFMGLMCMATSLVFISGGGVSVSSRPIKNKGYRRDKDLADYEYYSDIAMRERRTGRDDNFNQNMADKAFARMVSKKK